MVWCDRGVQMLLTMVGAFAAFSLMTIAIGTDYWLYSSANICNGTNVTTPDDTSQSQPKKVKGDLTHSGLWRICCIEGSQAGRARVAGGRGVGLRALCVCVPARSAEMLTEGEKGNKERGKKDSGKSVQLHRQTVGAFGKEEWKGSLETAGERLSLFPGEALWKRLPLYTQREGDPPSPDAAA